MALDQKLATRQARIDAARSREQIREQGMKLVNSVRGAFAGIMDVAKSLKPRGPVSAAPKTPPALTAPTSPTAPAVKPIPTAAKPVSPVVAQTKPAAAAPTATATPPPAPRTAPNPSRKKPPTPQTASKPQQAKPRNGRALAIGLALGGLVWGTDQWANNPKNESNPVAEYIQQAEDLSSDLIKSTCRDLLDRLKN